ncbi:MAG: hypothetical protein GXP43_02705 [bacterium]|nr:hypothetical protein [bacterium]
MKWLIGKMWIGLAFVFVFGFLAGPARAEADRKIGVHILFPGEIEAAAEAVGEGGYVVVPISMADWQKLEKWQVFMEEAKKLKLKPILRLVTYADGAVWRRPEMVDAVDWANFLSLLDWPAGDRWVIVFNEPNHANEWGGVIDPEGYALILKEFAVKLHAKDTNFKVLPAAMDMAAGWTKETMPAQIYLRRVWSRLPEFDDLADGWNAHAYPNPAFSARPRVDRQNNIASYKYEISWFKDFYKTGWTKPIFITETGWSKRSLNEKTIKEYAEFSWQSVWKKDKQLKAVVWFLLNGSPGPFADFSLMSAGELTEVGRWWRGLD